MTADQIKELAKNILQAPVLLAAVGAIISLLTSYVPRFREWYAGLLAEQKALGQLGIITLIVILAGVLSWTGIIPIVTPDISGVIVLIFSWFLALQANQTAYSYSKPVASVVMIKEQNRIDQLKEAKTTVAEDQKEEVAEAKNTLKEVLKANTDLKK